MERKKINAFLISILLSIILFSTINVNIYQYTIIFLIIWGLLLCNYSFKKNVYIYDLLILIFIGNYSVYIIFSTLSDFDYTSTRLYCNLFILFYFLIVSIKSSINYYKRKEKNNEENDELFPQRQLDMERLIKLIYKNNIVGINASWGEGKTFLVDRLKDEIKEEYEIIDIDILTCNFNELEVSLISKIEKIMYKNKLLSQYSNRLKEIITNQSFLSRMNFLLFENSSSFSGTIKGFKKEIGMLDKRIIISFEDIDRISDENLIKRIFALSERLANNNIKILYQYDEEKLNELGFNSVYLEKYIPNKMTLTKINFFDVIQLVFMKRNNESKLLSINDLSFLRDYLYGQHSIAPYIESLKNISIKIENINITIRKVESFLKQIEDTLEDKEYQKYKRIVIVFYFLKEFLPDIYIRLNIGKGIIETFMFNNKKEEVTFFELIQQYENDKLEQSELENILKDDKNKSSLLVISLFDYNYRSRSEILAAENWDEKYKAVVEESPKMLKLRYSNQKKNRLIWNLIANGKSKFTNYEYISRLFIENVLTEKEEFQKKAYEKFYKDIDHAQNSIDNRSIFLMGTPDFIEMFKAFLLINPTSNDQIGLIKFYIRINEKKVLNEEVLQAFYYLDIRRKEVFLFAIKCICELDIKNNLNESTILRKFLNKYILAMDKFAGLDHRYALYDGVDLDKYQEETIEELNRIISKMISIRNDLYTNCRVEEINKDFNLQIKFIKKMIELIKCKEPYITNKKRFNVEVSSKRVFHNQEEFDRLNNIKKEEQFTKELRKSYINDKINIYEIKNLLKRRN